MKKTTKQLAEIAAAHPREILFDTLLDFIRAKTDSKSRIRKKFHDYFESVIRHLDEAGGTERDAGDRERIVKMNMEIFKRDGIIFGHVEGFKEWHQASKSAKRAESAKVKHQKAATAKLEAARLKAEKKAAKKTKPHVTNLDFETPEKAFDDQAYRDWLAREQMQG